MCINIKDLPFPTGSDASDSLLNVNKQLENFQLTYILNVPQCFASHMVLIFEN